MKNIEELRTRVKDNKHHVEKGYVCIGHGKSGVNELTTYFGIDYDDLYSFGSRGYMKRGYYGDDSYYLYYITKTFAKQNNLLSDKKDKPTIPALKVGQFWKDTSNDTLWMVTSTYTNKYALVCVYAPENYGVWLGKTYSSDYKDTVEDVFGYASREDFEFVSNIHITID